MVWDDLKKFEIHWNTWLPPRVVDWFTAFDVRFGTSRLVLDGSIGNLVNLLPRCGCHWYRLLA